MKTKDEILNEHGCPSVPFDENVTMFYPAIIDAMEQYAQQQLKEAEKAINLLENAYKNSALQHTEVMLERDKIRAELKDARGIIKRMIEMGLAHFEDTQEHFDVIFKEGIDYLYRDRDKAFEMVKCSCGVIHMEHEKCPNCNFNEDKQ